MNLQSLSYLHYPETPVSLDSPQGQGGMTLLALGGVNLSCSWYHVREQPPSTGGKVHTHSTTILNWSVEGFILTASQPWDKEASNNAEYDQEPNRWTYFAPYVTSTSSSQTHH